MNKFIPLVLSLAIWTGNACAQNFPNIERFDKGDRVLILAPHPDDEAIACAGIIQNALARGADVRVVYLTYGEHNELAFIVYRKIPPVTRWDFQAMGQVRRKEAIRAMKYLGLDEDRLIFLGYPDFGTFDIFSGYWNTKKPFWSLMTRISAVPYKNALSFGAPYVGESILKDVKDVLIKYRPNKIFVSHPADVNVDHKTFYLFLEVALADLKDRLPRPRVYPYLVHAYGWPLPRHFHPLLKLEPPEKFSKSVVWWKYRLSPQQLKKKHRSVLFYRSQTNSSAFYLLAFVRKNELFGDFPPIDLVPRKRPVAEKRAGEIDGLLDSLRSMVGLPAGSPVAEVPQRPVLSGQSGPDTYSVEGDNLVIRIKKDKVSAKHRVISWVYLFGYSYKKPFANMPKLRIYTKYSHLRAFDCLREIEVPGASVSPSPGELVLTIPLKAMGDPDFILVSVRSYTGALPVYTSGFRRIDLTMEAANDRFKTR